MALCTSSKSANASKRPAECMVATTRNTPTLQRLNIRDDLPTVVCCSLTRAERGIQAYLQQD